MSRTELEVVLQKLLPGGMAVIRYSWNSWLPMTVAELKTIAFYHPEFEFEMIIEGASPVAISELADERELKEDTLIIKRKTLSETSFPNHLLPVGEIKYTPDSISQLEEDPLHPTSKRVSDARGILDTMIRRAAKIYPLELIQQVLSDSRFQLLSIRRTDGSTNEQLALEFKNIISRNVGDGFEYDLDTANERGVLQELMAVTEGIFNVCYFPGDASNEMQGAISLVVEDGSGAGLDMPLISTNTMAINPAYRNGDAAMGLVLLGQYYALLHLLQNYFDLQKDKSITFMLSSLSKVNTSFKLTPHTISIVRTLLGCFGFRQVSCEIDLVNTDDLANESINVDLVFRAERGDGNDMDLPADYLAQTKGYVDSAIASAPVGEVGSRTFPEFMRLVSASGVDELLQFPSAVNNERSWLSALKEFRQNRGAVARDNEVAEILASVSEFLIYELEREAALSVLEQLETDVPSQYQRVQRRQQIEERAKFVYSLRVVLLNSGNAKGEERSLAVYNFLSYALFTTGAADIHLLPEGLKFKIIDYLVSQIDNSITSQLKSVSTEQLWLLALIYSRNGGSRNLKRLEYVIDKILTQPFSRERLNTYAVLLESLMLAKVKTEVQRGLKEDLLDKYAEILGTLGDYKINLEEVSSATSSSSYEQLMTLSRYYQHGTDTRTAAFIALPASKGARAENVATEFPDKFVLPQEVTYSNSEFYALQEDCLNLAMFHAAGLVRMMLGLLPGAEVQIDALRDKVLAELAKVSDVDATKRGYQKLKSSLVILDSLEVMRKISNTTTVERRSEEILSFIKILFERHDPREFHA
ncbi:MAG: hypothetical protein KBC84_11620, partial [Proteobacteria bacterium]|nr:hypothetical protein [Pseudomonadota bacterium]